MKIIEVKENKKQYLDLLLLADEQENMIDRYLDKGKMYVLDDNGIKCECIVTDEGSDVLEIKNIATVPDYQGKGYAKSLIDFIVEKYREQYAILQVGTGDSPLTIPFYEKCGFVRSHIIPNFFTDNYDHPIYEDGVQCGYGVSAKAVIKKFSVIRSVDVLIFLRYTPSKRSVLLWVEKFMTSSMTWQKY